MGQVELSQIIKNERFWKFILYFYLIFFRKYEDFDIFQKLKTSTNQKQSYQNDHFWEFLINSNNL